MFLEPTPLPPCCFYVSADSARHPFNISGHCRAIIVVYGFQQIKVRLCGAFFTTDTLSHPDTQLPRPQLRGERHRDRGTDQRSRRRSDTGLQAFPCLTELIVLALRLSCFIKLPNIRAMAPMARPTPNGPRGQYFVNVR